MQIVTNSGKTFDAEWVLETETRNGIQQLTMHLTGKHDPAEVIGELVGQPMIVGIKENGNRNTFEKYTLFRSLIATNDGKALRLTLERDDEA